MRVIKECINPRHYWRKVELNKIYGDKRNFRNYFEIFGDSGGRNFVQRNFAQSLGFPILKKEKSGLRGEKSGRFWVNV